MNYVLAVVRFILTVIVALLLVLLLAGCTVGPKYIKPTVATTPTYKEEAPASFNESDQWQPAQPGRSDKPRKLVGDFWRFGAQQTGRADRRFQPEPKSSGSALPRSSCSDSLQSSLAVSNHLHCAER